jgi:hypothetical protein
MITVEELAFLKAHLADLPATALKQLRWDILTERRRCEAKATAKVKGGSNRLTGQSRKRHIGCNEGGISVSQTAPKPPRARAKPTSWTRSTWAVRWSQPAGARPPSQCPQPGPRFCLHRQRGPHPRPGGETQIHERTSCI